VKVQKALLEHTLEKLIHAKNGAESSLSIIRVISRILKFRGGGIDKCLGGVSMCETQLYIKKH